MPIIRNLLAVAMVVLFAGTVADGQSTLNVASVNCITGTASACNSSVFRSTDLHAYNLVTAAGYYAPADGGAGQFAKNVSPAPTDCELFSASGGSVSSGQTTINFSPAVTNNNIAVGMAVFAPSGIFPSNDTIASIAKNTGGQILSITMFSAATATASSATFKFSWDNGGSILGDNEGGGVSACFSRASSTYGPREWGAKQDYPTSDDTASLQNWLNANQPHMATPGNSSISSPLTCNDGGIIQGSPTEGAAEDPHVLPTFQITAGSSFTGSAMLIMQPDSAGPTGNYSRCALHGVGLIGDGSGNYDIVDAEGSSDVIDGHSYLSGGYYNVKAVAPGSGSAQHNFELYDSSLNNSVSDNLLIYSANAKVSRNSIAGAGASNIDLSGDSDVLVSDNINQQASG